jgi:CheY-like chemotaxis protein
LRDNGSGMDAATLARIFEPFFTTKAVGKGTGLGLSTVYGAVKQNHGFITVQSEPEHGTTFTISLPRHLGQIAQARTGDPAGLSVRGHETILLVEDELAILALTTKLLERQGYTVLAASEPHEAIRLAQEHTGVIHLLVTDVIMPRMNGRDLAGNLQSRYPGLACLFMSGYSSDVIVHQGVLDAGVLFIQKPFSRQELAAKVREALEHRGV